MAGLPPHCVGRRHAGRHGKSDPQADAVLRPALSNRKGKVMQQNDTATARPIKVPGPDHPITIESNPNRVVVSVAGRVIAQTRDSLTLREAAYPTVHYIPRKDVDMALLQRTDHSTYCPIKATAPISVFRSVASVRPTPSGRMRRPTQRWCPSRTTWPSTPIASTRSKNDLEIGLRWP